MATPYNANAGTYHDDAHPRAVHQPGEPLPEECPTHIYMDGEVWVRTDEQWEWFTGAPSTITEMDDGELRNCFFTY